MTHGLQAGDVLTGVGAFSLLGVKRKKFELQDRMVRKPCGSFALFVAGELPGDPETERGVTLEEVFAWYRDCPEQIERTTGTNLPSAFYVYRFRDYTG